MQPVSNDATTALLRAIRARFKAADSFILDEIRSRAWASATFIGARHEMKFRIFGEGTDGLAAHFLDTLDVAEFQLRGHIMADVALLARTDGPGWVGISLEALTVEDG